MIFAKIKIHFSLFILLTIALIAGFLTEACLFLLIIIFHELGHLLFLIIFKGEIKQITFTAVGGIIELKSVPLSISKSFLINTGGILVNLIILFILKNDFINVPHQKTIMQYNQLMLGFNLLPIYPLDGYRILANLLSIWYEEEYLNDVLSYLSLLGITFLSIFAYLAKSIGLGLIIIFLLVKTIKQKQENNLFQIKKYLKFKKIFQ